MSVVTFEKKDGCSVFKMRRCNEMSIQLRDMYSDFHD